MPTNARWIGFLRNYGPIPTNANMFDERIERARQRAGVEPGIRLSAPMVQDALRVLRSDPPASVVLTGTAGDGKSYHSRQIWLQLGGDAGLWDREDPSTPGLLELPIGNRRLLVVKDLSELNTEASHTFFERIFTSFALEGRPTVFMIAANVGQLHDEWQKALAKFSAQFPAAQGYWKDIEGQLFGETTHAVSQVVVFDLSRGRSDKMVTEVLDQVLRHPAWSGCDACELLQTDKGPCPIRANRARMLDGEAGELFRRRLQELVYLQAQNGRHLTVRHLLMLVVNALVGHSNVKQHLMACSDVAAILREGSHSQGAVYRNVFGGNLPPRQRSNREVFDKLSRVGIGTETSNRIDRLLTYGPDDPHNKSDYEAFVGNDELYGHTTPWENIRYRYLESGEAEEFLPAIRQQRERLFFTVPEEKAKDLGLWELTVYHYAADFLRTVEAIAANRRPPGDVIKRLVRGLNRVFTGQLLKQDDALVVASSGSSSQSKTSLIYEGNVPVAGDHGERIDIARGRRTDIALRVLIHENAKPVDLDLTVLRFEFLNRVADGALPSSFSLECHEDMLAYKARVLREIEGRRHSRNNEGPAPLKLLEVTAEGRVQPHTIEVNSHA
jgi:hypothetical protein